jgi:hypothetical protein
MFLQNTIQVTIGMKKVFVYFDVGGREDDSPAELHSNIKLNVYVRTQELAQLVKTTRLPADALIFTGNICSENSCSSSSSKLFSYINSPVKSTYRLKVEA